MMHAARGTDVASFTGPRIEDIMNAVSMLKHRRTSVLMIHRLIALLILAMIAWFTTCFQRDLLMYRNSIFYFPM
jgi:hypothetical protein